MRKFLRYSLILVMIVVIDAVFYYCFLRPVILTWGASSSEVSEALPGDDLAPNISSTRAITINAPISDVWKWLVQLGADRGGFYSYTFIEHLSGYDTDNSIFIVPEYQSMEVGRMVPSTRAKSGARFYENWRVAEVDPGTSFVLEKWGAFVLKRVNFGQTRLIVRTHGWDTPNMASRIGKYILEPLHYLMERRMLMGIRDRVEAGPGVPLSLWPDMVWFIGIVLSGLGVLASIFIFRGIYKILFPAVFGALWLVTLLIINPQPVCSVGLLSAMVATSTWSTLKRAQGLAK